MRPFAGARPHGHPPLSLRPPFWRPLFYPISPSATRARSPRRRCRPRYRCAPVRRLDPQQSPPAHAPDSRGRAAAWRAHFARNLASDRYSPGREPRANRDEAKPAEHVFDRIEIRRMPAPGMPSTAKFDIVFPAQSTLTLADGTKTSLSLKDAKASLALEEGSNRFSETLASFAGARLEHASTGDWVSFGPLSMSSKLAGAADGGWSNPIDFELKQIEFFLSEVPVGGAIERIAYTALSSGPDVAALNRLRARMDELREQGEQATTARADALLELLPTLPALFSLVKGETILEGLAVRAANGEPLVGLAKASLGGALTGLSGDTAAWRITFHQTGLTLASSILDPAKVPQTVVIDLGLENVATGPLRTILEAIAKARKEADGPGSQQAMQRMIGAAAMLNPVFRIY